MNKWYLSVARRTCYDWASGDPITGYVAGGSSQGNDAFIPEQWANEGLAILEENMVMANLVSRDFEPEVRNYGDVVNTRRPGTFSITRKADGDTLVPETAAATNVPVRLDQWFYKNFVIKDGEASLSFQDLVDQYLTPAMQVIARSVDRAILGRIHAYLGGVTGRAGKLDGMTSTTSYDDVLEARQRLNENLASPSGRNLVLSSASETAMLKNPMFVRANERGDGGSALENANLGRIAGFNTFLDQNVNSAMTAAADIEAVTVSSGPHLAGDNSALSLTASETAVVGEYLVIPTNGQPTWVVTLDAGATPDTVVLNEPLKYWIDDDEPAIRYLAAEVDGSTNFAIGYSKGIPLTHTSGKNLQIGQLVSFGTTPSTRTTYTVIEATIVSDTATTVTLDRPLEVAVGYVDKAFPGPGGSMNWAFHRDAIALVSRPLALPNSQMGVLTKVGVHNGISMRVCMQYDIDAGGTKVNLDLLCGVAVLNSGLCVPLLG